MFGSGSATLHLIPGEVVELEDLEPLVNYSHGADPGSCLLRVGGNRLLRGRLLGWQGESAEVQLRDFPVRYLTNASQVFRLPEAYHDEAAAEQETNLMTPDLTWPICSQISLGKLTLDSVNFNVSELNHVKILPGQECYFLEFGASSELAYVKPVYEEDAEEERDLYQLDRVMLEACTFHALREPPTLGQVVSVPRHYQNYTKYIRLEGRITRHCLLVHCTVTVPVRSSVLLLRGGYWGKYQEPSKVGRL